MAKFFLLGVLILCGALFAFGQQSAPTPPPAPAPTPVATRTPVPITRVGGLTPGLNSVNGPPGFGPPIESDPMARRMILVQKYAVPMYRKPSGKELKLLTPDAELTAKYSELLRREDSGIFKLVPDAGCAESTKVVNASEKCLKYLFPGAANSFSFRTESYRARQLADITYVKGGFWMTGVLMHGIMVDLGNIPIEQVTLKTPALGFISSFKPVDDFKKAVEVDSLLCGGVFTDGYTYRRNLPVAGDHTYVVRTVAYQGKVMRSVRGADYNELDFDKRSDVITAFRVARIDDDGTLTIIWTKLSTARAPKIKVPNKGADAKFTGASNGNVSDSPEQ